MATDLEIKLAAMMDVLRKQRNDILDALVDAEGQKALLQAKLAQYGNAAPSSQPQAISATQGEPS